MTIERLFLGIIVTECILDIHSIQQGTSFGCSLLMFTLTLPSFPWQPGVPGNQFVNNRWKSGSSGPRKL